jgi:hypothetical protein
MTPRDCGFVYLEALGTSRTPWRGAVEDRGDFSRARMKLELTIMIVRRARRRVLIRLRGLYHHFILDAAVKKGKDGMNDLEGAADGRGVCHSCTINPLLEKGLKVLKD